MRGSQPSRFTSGQQQRTFIQQQLAGAGLTGLRPPPQQQQQVQQKLPPPNEYQANPNRIVNTGVQNASSSSSIPTFPTQDGVYRIIQVRNPGEFYGLSQNREKEFAAFSKHLADIYNNPPANLAANDGFVMDGTVYVIQNEDKYQRVVVKRRESETRVSVKQVDRGDEIIVDITELLPIDKSFTTVPAFAQPFRLRGYEDSQNSPITTQNFKKLVTNQIVHITASGTTHNGFSDVEVCLSNNQSVNKIILSNEKLQPIPPPAPAPIPSTRANFNQPSAPTHVESQVFSNSSRHHPNHNHDFHTHRTNDVLPAPQKILTAPTRPTVNRFSSTSNQQPPSSNEQMPRFSSATNRNPPAQTNETNSMWNKPNSNANQSTFGRQQSGPMQRNDENQPMSFDQKRSFNDDDDRQTNENNDNGFRRGTVFSSRGRGGAGHNDRYSNRNNEENRNDNNFQSSSGGYQRRGGGFGDRGGRNDFQDRNRDDDRSQNFRNNNNNRGRGFSEGRGGFSNRRDQGDNNDSGRRGGRGGPRGASNSNRGNFHSRDRNDNDIQLTSDTSSKPFGNWSDSRPTNNVEIGDQFPDNEIPKDSFKFVVSHVETPNEFYIQLLSKGDQVSSLTETLQNDFKQCPEANLRSFTKNQACLGQSSDGCWYRAIVLSTGVTQLKIRFIDFGDTADVDDKRIRKIAKKFCSTPPYAYACTFANVEVAKDVKLDKIIDLCAEKQFQGTISLKTTDGKYLLECESLLQALKDINVIQIQPIKTVKHTKCLIAHIEKDQHEFYIQDDIPTLDHIADLVEQEDQENPILSVDEVNQLEANTIIIAKYEDEPFRGIIKSKQSDEELNIYFIDFGNTSSCPIDSLKRASEQLSSFASQAKHCHLYGIPSDQINAALDYLGDHSDPDSNEIEYSIVNEENQIFNILIYLANQCLNEKFGYDPTKPQIVSTTETENEEKFEYAPTEPQTVSTTETENEENTLETPVELKQETDDETKSKSRSIGRLTHTEKTKPYVYLQFPPESETMIGEINHIIENIVQENKRNSDYNVGESIIAKFSEDGEFYRARIESYSTSTELYTIYFLDYGNLDENVTNADFYSYSDEFKSIEPQAHGYLLEKIPLEKWTNTIQTLIKDKYINEDFEFDYIDDNQSVIHIYFPDEDQIYSNDEQNPSLTSLPVKTIEEKQTFSANICSTDSDCFYVQFLPDDNLNAGEIEDILQTCDKQTANSWSINDRCLVKNDQEKYFRGKIRSITENHYDVECIDYGYILSNRNNEQLYQLPNDDLLNKPALAHQCRLFGYDDDEQREIIDDMIRKIPTTETVQITVENENNSCLYVILIRENKDIVNRQKSDNKQDKTTNETINIEDNLSTLSITNNQTIDFGENDPSTTLKDETNNSIP